MKTLSERHALFVAVITSGAVLFAALGFAIAKRPAQFSTSPASGATSGRIATVSRGMTAEAAQGRHLFLLNCAHCHGDDASGDEGPNLHNLLAGDALIHLVVTGGIKGEMPSFARKLNDSDVRALTAYLRTLGN